MMVPTVTKNFWPGPAYGNYVVANQGMKAGASVYDNNDKCFYRYENGKWVKYVKEDS